tara:strand:- start:363 stop:494 length:132 start_codon:yes stop_codon:yes gene_type:complete
MKSFITSVAGRVCATFGLYSDINFIILWYAVDAEALDNAIYVS